MGKIYVRMPDGRKLSFATLEEMNKFLDKDEKEEKKRKKKAEKFIDTSVFKKKDKKGIS